MPDAGEDPYRVTQRLPGTAASGASAVAHFRGGEQGEIGIMSMASGCSIRFTFATTQSRSIIDARAIEGVEVYTGGFPGCYGDRMSGLVLMDSLEPEKPRHTEIGISVEYFAAVPRDRMARGTGCCGVAIDRDRP